MSSLKRFNSLQEIHDQFRNGTLSCVNLAEHYLANIEKNADLNAFREVFADECLQNAKNIDKKLQEGKAGKLAGMFIAIKDNIAYKNHRFSASSKILDGFETLFNATVVEKLLGEDAIIIGRTNCDEFAMGASNENSAFGPVRNAFDKSRVPGGSSGGSAVAVQADMCLAALGTDTGGSIRQPAAFTGLYGMYPTYGRVSRWGLIAYASSFDQAGPLTSSIHDMALLMSVISGPDEHDATALQTECTRETLPVFDKPLKLAYLSSCLEHPGLDAGVKQQFFRTVDQLKKAGHSVESVDFDMLDALVPVYYVLTTAEASSNLSRYSGLTHGYRSTNATDLESTFKLSRKEGFGAEVKRRIMLGTFVLSSDYYDAYYTKAQKVRRLIKERTMALLHSYDAIVLPTTSTAAFKLGEKTSDPIAMYLADLFTVQANLAGTPALSVPFARHPESNLPIGFQIIGKPLEEGKIMAVGKLVIDLSEVSSRS